ncbi:MAG: lipopolysaccharide heptosyltransferase I [bacterium]
MRVLLIKMSSLGDVVHALPAVSDAAAHGITFDWVVEEAFADIPALHPAVHQVIPIAWRRWRKNLQASSAEMSAFRKTLVSTPYDLVIDSQGLIKSALVSVLSRARKHGFSHTTAREPWAAFFYGKGHRVELGQHAIDRQRQLFAAALGYAYNPQVLPAVGTAVRASERSRQVFLLHGTTWATKHWPPMMWQALAQQISAAGYEPVLTWGDDVERQRAEQIAQASGAHLQDRIALKLLAPRLARSACVIGVDSGLTHLAAALGAPTLGVYGPTDGVLTGCRGPHAKILQSDFACAPCLSSSCRYRGAPQQWQSQNVSPPCFAQLSPALVWQHARNLMRQG